MAEQTNPEEKSLGLQNLPGETIEHDFKIAEMYIAFSAEILRLSLVSIGGVSFLLTIVLKDKIGTDSEMFRTLLSFSLIFLGCASALALSHRYYASDSMAYHIEAVRKECYKGWNSPKAKEARDVRNERMKTAYGLIAVSAGMLALGVIFLAASFVCGLTQTHKSTPPGIPPSPANVPTSSIRHGLTPDWHVSTSFRRAGIG